ncbi:MAG: hypothetical protein Q8T09_16930 [Candidatus Melainabacteria bacterium]|nr:hypothetical protein [Candidatus Melainabacteria bacterium]
MTAIARWLESRPAASIGRLKKINQAATSSAHIILALSYGLSDPHIRAINRMIVGLLLSRHKAQRSGNKLVEERTEAKLQDLHEAINRITGTTQANSHDPGIDAGNACKRAIPRQPRNKMELNAS